MGACVGHQVHMHAPEIAKCVLQPDKSIFLEVEMKRKSGKLFKNLALLIETGEETKQVIVAFEPEIGAPKKSVEVSKEALAECEIYLDKDNQYTMYTAVAGPDDEIMSLKSKPYTLRSGPRTIAPIAQPITPPASPRSSSYCTWHTVLPAPAMGSSCLPHVVDGSPLGSSREHAIVSLDDMVRPDPLEERRILSEICSLCNQIEAKRANPEHISELMLLLKKSPKAQISSTPELMDRVITVLAAQMEWGEDIQAIDNIVNAISLLHDFFDHLPVEDKKNVVEPLKKALRSTMPEKVEWALTDRLASFIEKGNMEKKLVCDVATTLTAQVFATTVQRLRTELAEKLRQWIDVPGDTPGDLGPLGYEGIAAVVQSLQISVHEHDSAKLACQILQVPNQSEDTETLRKQLQSRGERLMARAWMYSHFPSALAVIFSRF
mmetsp:Transcript_31629/g.58344  ORF Transcript_31629/g.58344 Transcript_31629/m.58344 type:complete len:435 (-) Transcript_31629:145-1449(-)